MNSPVEIGPVMSITWSLPAPQFALPFFKQPYHAAALKLSNPQVNRPLNLAASRSMHAQFV
ncbi:MAG: hypothetical protein JOZ72_01735 [Alphaproteobacteria bacterium]|nr:hypothetical protein [Alphaproteobacteria bacterium]